MKPEFLQYVKENMSIDDMPTDDMRFLADAIGVPQTIEIMEKLAGARFFVPFNWSKNVAKRYIVENCGKLSVRELVIETGISDSVIYMLINRKMSDLQAKNQTSLFDVMGRK